VGNPKVPTTSEGAKAIQAPERISHKQPRTEPVGDASWDGRGRRFQTGPRTPACACVRADDKPRRGSPRSGKASSRCAGLWLWARALACGSVAGAQCRGGTGIVGARAEESVARAESSARPGHATRPTYGLPSPPARARNTEAWTGGPPAHPSIDRSIDRHSQHHPPRRRDSRQEEGINSLPASEGGEVYCSVDQCAHRPAGLLISSTTRFCSVPIRSDPVLEFRPDPGAYQRV
jgi:hypothetical protein